MVDEIYFEDALWEDIFRHRTQMPKPYVRRITPIMDRTTIGDTAIRTVRWKLLHRRARHVEAQVSWWGWLSGTPVERPQWELYDLKADPNEQTNVIQDHHDVAMDLKAQLLAWEKENGIALDAGEGG